MERVIHQFEPIFDENSKILMLGTMPSPKSREVGFYYGHPRNRFWKVVADVRKEVIPTTIQEKIDFLIKNKIALWEVVILMVLTIAVLKILLLMILITF